MNQIVRTDIVDEMKRSYIDYAMSVIVSRALPDVRDGLKPVHRRILYAMKAEDYTHNKPHKKSARIVGDVMGKYHPHGDSAIYETMVRLAQPFTMSLPFIDGQGNFGSVDGDPPAAMRYTEARLNKVAEKLLEEINRDTVDFVQTYDDSNQEPSVLPVMFPQALVNGTTGVAVGMATTILPHNLGEVIDATLLMMSNPGATDEEILKVMPGPDFPTGGTITGAAGIRDYFATGRGRITVDAVYAVEKGKAGRSLLVFTELPYQVSKTSLEEKITDLAGSGEIDGIHAVRDESGRQGTRFVVEVKADADPEVVLSHLRKLTDLRTTFSSNVIVIHHGTPKQMGVRQMIQAWIDFRRDTVTRRVTFDLNKSRDRLLLLSALLAVLDSKETLDWVVDTIRHSSDVGTARTALMEHEFVLNHEEARLVARAASDTPEADLEHFSSLYLTQDQAQAILDMRMARLTGLEHEKLASESRDLLDLITGLLAILNDPAKRDALIVSELQDIRTQFAAPRRSRLAAGEITDMATLDFIPRKDVVITITRQRYAKRQDVDDFRAQNKGGRGKSGIDLKDDDMVVQVLHTNTHADLVIITRCGMAYRIPVHVISDADRGKPLVNYVEQISGDVEIAAILALPADAAEADHDGRSLMFVFEDGQIRRSKLADFTGIRRNGKRATPEGSTLMTVLEARDDQDILLASSAGKTIRTSVLEFNVKISRTSTGVTGMKLGKGETLVAACVLDSGRWSPEEREGYLKMARKLAGAEGQDDGAGDDVDAVVAADISETMFAEMAAAEQILVMVTTKSFGKRSSAYEYRATGRATKGYKGMNVSEATGALIGLAPVAPGQGLMLVTTNGQMIRLRADDIRQQARATRGTRLFNLKAGEDVFALMVLPPEGEKDDEQTEDPVS